MIEVSHKKYDTLLTKISAKISKLELLIDLDYRTNVFVRNDQIHKLKQSSLLKIIFQNTGGLKDSLKLEHIVDEIMLHIIGRCLI